ncbi:MAG: FG-GAP-like repeat-containing protein [Kofleriaceae bacterium]
MRFKKLKRVMLTAALVAPVLAMAGNHGLVFTDQSWRLPADGSLGDTSSIDVDPIDVDGDGDLDLFIAEGTAGPSGRPNRLLINDGAGRFADQSSARLPPAIDNSSRSAAGDVDGDGDLDIIVGNLGPEQLLINDGTGHFADGSARLPPPPPLFEGISAEAALVDVDGDGDLDVAVANENPFLPGALQGAQNRLYINDGTGGFTDQTATRLPAATDQTGGLVAGDLDGDGDLDLIFLNRGQDRVYLNDGAGVFVDATATRMPAVDDTTRSGALADFDGDGDLDLVVANSRGEAPRRYTNTGGYLAEVEFSRSTFAHETMTSVEAADLDGDGDLDLVFADAGGFLAGHGFVGGQSRLFRNDGHGRFTDRTARALPAALLPTTDLAVGDLDGDGDLDLALANSGGPEAILIQRGDGRHGDDDRDDDHDDD